MSKGILFHNLGAHVENALSPYVLLDFCCKRSSWKFGRSFLEWFWYWNNSTKYRGPRPFRALKTSKSNLNKHGRKSEANEVLPGLDLYDQTHEHQIQRYCPQFLKGRLLAQEKLKTILMQKFVGENKISSWRTWKLQILNAKKSLPGGPESPGGPWFPGGPGGPMGPSRPGGPVEREKKGEIWSMNQCKVYTRFTNIQSGSLGLTILWIKCQNECCAASGPVLN